MHSTQKANLSRLSSEVNIFFPYTKRGQAPFLSYRDCHGTTLPAMTQSLDTLRSQFHFCLHYRFNKFYLIPEHKHMSPFNYLWGRKDKTDVSGRLDFVLFSWRGKGLYLQP